MPKYSKLSFILKNGSPLVVSTGHNDMRGMLAFTDHVLASSYMSKRGNPGNMSIVEWDIPYVINVISNIYDTLISMEIEWLVLDHPGETAQSVVHLKMLDIMKIPSHITVLRV